MGGEISRNKPILVHNQNYTNIQPRPNPVNHNPYALNNFQKQSLNRPMNTTMTGSAALDLNKVENDPINHGQLSSKPNIENDINYKLGHNEKTHVDAESLNDDHTNQNAFDFDKNEEESPKLFSEDTDINNNDHSHDESKIEPEIEKRLIKCFI